MLCYVMLCMYIYIYMMCIYIYICNDNKIYYLITKYHRHHRLSLLWMMIDDVVIMVDPRYWWSNTDPIDWWPCFEVHEASIVAGWWLVYLPLWKMMDFVSWDDYIFPIWWESHNPFMFQSPPRINGAHTTGAGWTCFLRRWEQTATSSNTFFCVSSMSAIAETMGPKICLPEHEKKNIFRWMMFLSLKLLETDCFWNEHVWMHV